MNAFIQKSRLAHSNPTVIGVTAIGLWSCLAPLTTLTAGIPPFQLLSLSFAIAFVSSVLALVLRGPHRLSEWLQPWPVWISGFLGIFTYHALYFFALKAAPPAEASLIAYLWPLFIVLLSTLNNHHERSLKLLFGTLLGLGGTVLIVLQGETSDREGSVILGYLAALAAALVWSSYSVFNKRFQQTPSSIIGGVCGAVAVAGWACHLLFESSVQPTTKQWTAIIALGLGPVGLAFLAWDHATKHGNVAMLGALAYLAPMISILLLILSGQINAKPVLLLAALLIISGAVISTYSSQTTQKTPASSKGIAKTNQQL